MLNVTGEGRATSPLFLNNQGAKVDARNRAAQNMLARSQFQVAMAACPDCGKYQHDMLRMDRAFWRGSFIAVIIASVILFWNPVVTALHQTIPFDGTFYAILLATPFLSAFILFFIAGMTGSNALQKALIVIAIGVVYFIFPIPLPIAILIGILCMVGLILFWRGYLFDPNSLAENRKKKSSEKTPVLYRHEYEALVKNSKRKLDDDIDAIMKS